MLLALELKSPEILFLYYKKFHNVVLSVKMLLYDFAARYLVGRR